MDNPYAISFGSVPEHYIPRIAQREAIIHEFNRDRPGTHAFIIVGVRGGGKTVLLSEVAKHIGSNWVVIDISVQDDILKSVTAQLYEEKSVHNLFVKAKIDISVLGFGLQIENSIPAFTYQSAITQMLEVLQKKGKRVLITIDEVANTQNIRQFASVFQILVRNDLPVFILGAGIPENVFQTVNDHQSTFLMRTQKIELPPLNTSMIHSIYKSDFNLTDEAAWTMAHLTKGYPFAFQVLGYVCWGQPIDMNSFENSDILQAYDFYLQDFAYAKIWDEMSETDRRVAVELAKLGESAKVADIMEKVGMKKEKFSVYRARLKKRDVLNTEVRGTISFSLPRFREFVLSTEEYFA